MRLIGIVVLLLLPMTEALAAEQEDDEECMSLGGTVVEFAGRLRSTLDEKAGFRAASCYTDDPVEGGIRFDLILHAERIYDVGQKEKIRYNGELIEIFERPQCPGGGIVVNGSPIVARGDRVRVLEPASGGLGTRLTFEWISRILLRGPKQSHTSFEAALSAKPSRTCPLGEEFARWSDEQIYGKRRRPAP